MPDDMAMENVNKSMIPNKQTVFNSPQTVAANYQVNAAATLKSTYSAYAEACDTSEVEQYMPVEVAKPFLRKLINYMNDDDAKRIIKNLMDELGKENPDIKLSENIETAILAFGIDKVS